MKSSSVYELRRKVVFSTPLHNSQFSSLSCFLSSLLVLFYAFRYNTKGLDAFAVRLQTD